MLSPGNRGEEANFDPSPFFEDRAALSEFHGFGEVASRDERVTAERQWRQPANMKLMRALHPCPLADASDPLERERGAGGNRSAELPSLG